MGSNLPALNSKVHSIAFLITLVVVASPHATAQQPGPHDQVVVTANVYPVPFENLSRSVTVITRDEISRLPVHSIAGVLEYASAVDVRSRVPFGLQSDISIRGSSYSQVLILVDGVRINDSQTAHHNADFPVALQDVERIEILHGAGSSLFGADASGGIINILTRRDTGSLQASATAGAFGLLDAGFGARFRKAGIQESLSASASRSSGFMYDRDFSSLVFSSRTEIGKSSIYVSHRSDHFGANGFYGPAPSSEWEDQSMVSFERHLDATAVLRGYYRTHGDRFLYDIRDPGHNENTHRTHAAGVSAKSQWSLADTVTLSAGAEAGADTIRSSNLGDHSFCRMSLFGELQWKPARAITIDPGLRWDHYSNFGSAASPSLSASWWISGRAKLRSSVAHAFRIPTFTELYYRDPNNEGDPTIQPEKAWSADAGVDVFPAKDWMASLTVFSRDERDVIDWVRRSTAAQWRTANIRRLRTRGVEMGLEYSPSSRAHLALHYTQMDTGAGSIDFFSKYVLDYARHAWTASGRLQLPLALTGAQKLTYRKHADGRAYWIVDLRLERRFGHFTAVSDLLNALNSRFQEVPGVDMPGRWFTAGLRFDLPISP
jgi:outer membrane cobalamin receptor